MPKRNRSRASETADTPCGEQDKDDAEDPMPLKSCQAIVKAMFGATSITTTTKAGWCLKKGLTHVMTVDNGRLSSLVQLHGPPAFYKLTPGQYRHEPTDNMNAPQDCFQSLCRIIAGQQLAGAAARTVWNRLLETTHPKLTPTRVMELSNQGIDQHLQKPAGLSRAKARAIVDLSQHFHQGVITEELLTSSNQADVRNLLLQVKGLGPWSCDMFLMFYLERPDILPLGDLGVRKGIARHFEIRGKGKQGALCPKRDLQQIQELLEPYKPYQSLLTYYMWRAADTVDFYNTKKTSRTTSTASPEKVKRARVVVTP